MTCSDLGVVRAVKEELHGTGTISDANRDEVGRAVRNRHDVHEGLISVAAEVDRSAGLIERHDRRPLAGDAGSPCCLDAERGQAVQRRIESL